MRRSIALAALFLLPSAAIADPAGERIVVTAATAEVRDGEAVTKVERGRSLTTEKSEDDRLWVNDSGIRGWIRRDAVVPEIQAADYFTSLIEREPSAEAYFDRAVSVLKRGDRKAARSDLDEAIRLDPRFVKAYLNRGVVRGLDRDWAGAESDLTEAIRLDATNADAYETRGVVRWHAGDTRSGLADLNEAIRIAPSFRRHSHRGNVRQDSGDLDGALEDFDEAIRLGAVGGSTDYAAAGSVRMSRGILLERKGRYADAAAAYADGIRVAPAYPFGHRRAAWLAATCPDGRFRDGAAAVKQASVACELTGWKDPLILETLAAAYAETGDFDAASEWMANAVAAGSAGDDDRTQAMATAFCEHRPWREPAVAPMAE